MKLSFLFIVTFMPFLCGTFAFGEGEGDSRVKKCRERLAFLAAYHKANAKLPDPNSVVLDSSEVPGAKFRFDQTSFYDPNAVYIGVTYHDHWALQYYVIGRNWRVNADRHHTLIKAKEGEVPEATIGLLFKLPATPKILDELKKGMEFLEVRSAPDCSNPRSVMYLLSTAGIGVPNFSIYDNDYTAMGDGEHLLSALLFNELTGLQKTARHPFKGEHQPLQISLLASDHNAILATENRLRRLEERAAANPMFGGSGFPGGILLTDPAEIFALFEMMMGGGSFGGSHDDDEDGPRIRFIRLR